MWRQLVGNGGWSANMQMSLEAGLPLVEPSDVTGPAVSLVSTSRETLSQNHPSKRLPISNAWKLRETIHTSCFKCFEVTYYGSIDN